MLGKKFAALFVTVAMLLAASAPTVASAEGGAAPASTDATTACASPAGNAALASLCGLLAGNTLPEGARAEVTSMIVKLWKAAQEPAKITTPEAACALTPAPHTALPVLCTLWSTPSTLPSEIREVMGKLVVHLANGKFEAARLAPKPATDAGAKTAKAPSREKPKMDTSLLAKCNALLVEHPDDQGEKAQYCRKVVAGGGVAPTLAPKPKEPPVSSTPKP